jgi:formylglycine-generating enzyme required for sulfatase activity
MAVMSPGRFVMGWPTDLDNPQMENFLDELQVPVRIPRALAVGQFEVTFEEWDACLADSGCLGHRPADYGWGRGARPVIDVSFEHAKAYVGWLSSKTGKPYRLPSEAEHEYATRAGTQSAFWWGETITPHQANYDVAKAYAGGGETGSRSARQSPSTATAPIPGAFIMSTAMSGSGPRIAGTSRTTPIRAMVAPD